MELWRSVLGEHFKPGSVGGNLSQSKLAVQAEILDRIAAVNAGLRRADQAIQAVYDAESLRNAARSAKSAPSTRCVNCNLALPGPFTGYMDII